MLQFRGCELTPIWGIDVPHQQGDARMAIFQLGLDLRGWFNQSVGTCHILPFDIGKCLFTFWWFLSNPPFAVHGKSTCFRHPISMVWIRSYLRILPALATQKRFNQYVSRDTFPIFSPFFHHFFPVSQDVSRCLKVTISITWSTGAHLWPPWGTCQQPWDFWIRPVRDAAFEMICNQIYD